MEDNKFAIATLGKEGVITDPVRGLNYLMSCFFFSKYSQTTLYKGAVISLSKIIQTSGSDSSTFVNQMEEKLTEFLYRHFKAVDVTCRALSGDDDQELEVSLDVTVSLTDSLTVGAINLGYALTVSDGKFKQIIDKLNNETLYS